MPDRLITVTAPTKAARFAHPEQSSSDVVYAPLHDLVGGATARYLCARMSSPAGTATLEL
ncbi:hypothetical protein BTZ20_1597 [Rhodococcus sp. MTM3W5.2]|uniref:hypothetical protein n=1 Tax=Rhodococcus sp. MTM3W5.2 TaxID=1805827 RepID=UPI0009792051|nr:hypothetical protein [Rhodococcus sp. MTM3W5.2]AQA24328.1 hypothetical protein BTZ20_1597 [Rhodococcus sp. MTM3W5.2]